MSILIVILVALVLLGLALYAVQRSPIPSPINWIIQLYMFVKKPRFRLIPTIDRKFAPGEFSTIHQMDCRDPNTIYTAEINNWRSQKILLKPQPATKTSAN